MKETNITEKELNQHYKSSFKSIDEDLREINDNINNLQQHILKMNAMIELIDYKIENVEKKNMNDDKKDYNAINKLYDKRGFLLAEIESYQKNLNDLFNIRLRYRNEFNKIQSIILKHQIDSQSNDKGINLMDIIQIQNAFVKKYDDFKSSENISTGENALFSTVADELDNSEYKMD